MKKLVVLDIDETLIYASKNQLDQKHDFEVGPYFVYKRPYVDEFLEFCSEHFDVAIWTTAGEDFASNVYCKLFPDGYELKFLWSHEKCTPKFNPNLMETVNIKNLIKVKRKGYSLEHVIMVDDTPEKLEKNYGNLVRVNEFIGDTKDAELLHLKDYLLTLKNTENIRTIEKRGWRNRYET